MSRASYSSINRRTPDGLKKREHYRRVLQGNIVKIDRMIIEWEQLKIRILYERAEAQRKLDLMDVEDLAAQKPFTSSRSFGGPSYSDFKPRRKGNRVSDVD